jgi:Fe-S cluster biogenesis protein NfuA
MSALVPIQADDVLIRVQDTPNPMAIKFIVNFALKNIGNATFTKDSAMHGLPLVSEMFNIPGVEQVYLFQNTLTLTHNDELPVEILKEQVKSIIKTRLTVHDPDYETNEEKQEKAKPDRSHLPPEVQAIEDILDRTIRPGLQSDGGDVEILEFKDNTLKILYQGACGGCPSSMMGTLDAIQSILRNELKNEELIVHPV